MKKKIESIIMFFIIGLVLFVLLSTVSTLVYNFKIRYVEEYVLRMNEDDEIFDKANENLDIIKNSDNLKYSKEDKETIVLFLENVKNDIEKYKEEYKENDDETNYNYSNYGIVKKNIGLLKSIVCFTEDCEQTDLSVINLVMGYNKEKNVDHTKLLDEFSKRLYLNEKIINQSRDIVIPKYKYFNFMTLYEYYIDDFRLTTFDYEQFYLEFTEYIMEVGEIK